MLKQYMKWAILMAVMLSLILAACASPAQSRAGNLPLQEQWLQPIMTESQPLLK